MFSYEQRVQTLNGKNKYYWEGTKATDNEEESVWSHMMYHLQGRFYVNSF